jgi:hypothetical protein
MIAILDFFVHFAPLLYLVLAVGLVFGLWRWSQARSEQREAIYGLEKEIANRHTFQSLTTLIVVGSLAIGEFILIVFLAPNIPAFSRLPTPTLNPLALPTSTIPFESQQTLGIVTPLPTSTIQATGCIPGQIAITSPKAGDELRGQISITGSADIPNFGFYKYEFAPLGSTNWSTVLANRAVKDDASLGSWDTSTITPGDYQLRLVVTDNQGNELPACVVPVRIKAP